MNTQPHASEQYKTHKPSDLCYLLHSPAEKNTNINKTFHYVLFLYEITVKIFQIIGFVLYVFTAVQKFVTGKIVNVFKEVFYAHQGCVFFNQKFRKHSNIVKYKQCAI